VANVDHRKRVQRTRLGPWRLLDLFYATTSSRGNLLGGGIVLPEFGPPDEVTHGGDPEEELPDSNIAEHEQRQAIAREAARRYVRFAGSGGD
jgi:hypothetical protein